MRRLQPQWANHTLPLIACFAHGVFSFSFQLLHSMAATYWAYLDQRHLRAKSEQDFLRFGWVGVVSMLVEPLLQRPRHVLQSLTFVSDFTPAGTTPIGRKTSSEKQISKKKKKKEGEKVLRFWTRRLFKSFNCGIQICSRTRHYTRLAWQEAMDLIWKLMFRNRFQP